MASPAPRIKLPLFFMPPSHFTGFPDNSIGKESACNAGDPRFDSWVRKICWRDRLVTAVFLRFPGKEFLDSAGKESACSVGDLGLIPGLEKSLGEGNGYPLQYCGQENSMDYNPWDHKESNTAELLSLQTSAVLPNIGMKSLWRWSSCLSKLLYM